MENKSKSSFIAKIVVVLSIIFAIFTGGFFFLDKVIVPKYFGKYGINSVSELIGVVSSLYKTPNESKLITNPYTQLDFTNAVTKLQGANYLIHDNGSVYEEPGRGFKGDGKVNLTDREFAAVCNKLLDDNILVDVLPNLSYLNITKISVLQIKFTIDESSKIGEQDAYSSAKVNFIAKVDTSAIREQIAVQMNTPQYLLNMIIPEKLYFEVTYNVDVSGDENQVSNGSIAINGRTSKQSANLINLLVDFIFPEEDNMNLEKFTQTFGDIVLEGIGYFGEFKFIKNLGPSNNQAGISVT